jgi:hypothetical protein
MSQWVYAAASSKVRHGPSPSAGSECEPTPELSRGGALILVLLSSFGLWALIWATVSLLAAYGLR